MAANPRKDPDRDDPGALAQEEGWLERLAIRLVRFALLVYLLPVLCVAFALTWVMLIAWRSILLLESLFVRLAAGLGMDRGRPEPERRPGELTGSHLVASTIRMGMAGVQTIR